ncbi:LuxR C-terminal-related transcriptional regulator [Streptomyces yunnanensis]|uniref:LuxR C-terminal-related transcriptional regulator n=1 Tax=Streptomyces yunnanensis TaxID=156453 RepID=A0ABY8AMN2_9ACTN|nr:LuxR C-terminal-related transcriptional regulator [Streptomyces yunnanensis]WEB45886.1 LuxR C-terminal-related transcriptional regulator [Streptomyces yunnanensis]
MLSGLGIDSVTEAVYRTILARPDGDVADWATELNLSEREVREALDRLSGLALVRHSAADQVQVRAVNPLLGLEALLARQQAELAAHQQHVEASRAAAADVIAQYAQQYAPGAGSGFRYLAGIDTIREHLEILNSQVEQEFLTFAPGGPQTPENMAASRPLNLRLLNRGIRMRTVYLDSIRRDQATVEHAEWLTAQGAEVRTAPTLPNRLIVIDRKVALIAADSQNTGTGALVIDNPGTITLLCALFESTWQSSQPVGTRPERSPSGLTKQQGEVLRLMAKGCTDEAIAHHLGVSSRTVRRIAATLLVHLDAQSRFQAGAHAAQRGYLKTHSD